MKRKDFESTDNMKCKEDETNDQKRPKSMEFHAIPMELLRLIAQFSGTRIEVNKEDDVFQMFGENQRGEIDLVFDACNLHNDVILPDCIRSVHMSLLTDNANTNLINVPKHIREFNLTFNHTALDEDIIPNALDRSGLFQVEHLSLINSDSHFVQPKKKLHINIFNIVNNFHFLVSLKLNVDLKRVDLIFPQYLRYLHIIFKTNRRAKSFGLLDNLEVLFVEQGAWGAELRNIITPLLEKIGTKLHKITIHYQAMKLTTLEKIPMSVKHLSLHCHKNIAFKSHGGSMIAGIKKYMKAHQLTSLEINCTSNVNIEQLANFVGKSQPRIRSLTLHGFKLDNQSGQILARVTFLKYIKIKGGTIFKRGVRALYDANIHLSLECCEFNDSDVCDLLQERGISHDPDPDPEVTMYRTHTEREDSFSEIMDFLGEVAERRPRSYNGLGYR
jgi:hypothetical protein